MNYYSERHRQRVKRFKRFDNLKALSIALVLLVVFSMAVVSLYNEAKFEGKQSFVDKCSISQNMFGEYLNCPIGE